MSAEVSDGPTVQDCAARHHETNVANRERSFRAVNLALHFADQEVRWYIQRAMAMVNEGGTIWCDTRPESIEYHPDVAKAFQYIELRGPSAFQWRLIRHPTKPYFMRFEDTP